MCRVVSSVCPGESYSKLKVLPQRKCNAVVGGLSTTGDCLPKSILGFVYVAAVWMGLSSELESAIALFIVLYIARVDT